MTTFFLKPRAELTVNGRRRKMFTADATLGATSPIASGSFSVHPDEGEIAGGDEVRLKLGYWGGSYAEVLVAEVQDDTLVLWPNALTFSVQGFLARAGYALGVEGEEELDIDTGETLPLMEWISETDGVIISELLDMAGVPYGTIEDSGTLLGTVEPIALMPNEAPLDIIKRIDEALGYVTFDGPDGLVRRTRYSDIPAGSPALVISQGVNLAAGSRQRSSAEVYNRVSVKGVENAAFAPQAQLSSPSATSPTTGDPYIPTPPGYRMLPYSSTILDTEDLCAAFAARVLGEKNRLRWNTEVALAHGMPVLRPAQSCYIISEKIGFDDGSVFWIDQVKHRADANAFLTDLTLRGAYSAEGVSDNQDPVPAFTMLIKYEWTPSGGIWVILCDASGSSDPDGAYIIPATVNDDGMEVAESSGNGISLYEWDSSLGVTPSVSDDGQRATFVATANPDGETITLTVYDLQGRDKALTRPIVIDNDHPALVRDLWAAVDSELLFTNDGERTWSSIAIPAVFVVEMSAYDYTIALDASGTVYRVLSNLSFTTPASAPTNASAAYLRWVYPETRISGDRAWIGTDDGEIWFSSDRALTWTHVATLAGGPPITSIAESPFAENDVWITAGGGIWHGYDGVTYDLVYTHPNPLLTATNHTSGFAHGFAAFAGTNSDGSEASRVRERFGEIEGDWNRGATVDGLPVGVYKAAYTYRAFGGETVKSPVGTVTIAADQVLRFAPLTPLPQGAFGVTYYVSEVADSLILRKIGEGIGGVAFDVTDVPAPAAALAPTTNTTTLGIADPTVAPTVSAVAGTASGADFPAQPEWISIGVSEPLLMAVGSSPQNPDGAAWYATVDAAFTFKLGEYDITMGQPRHVIRDGDFDGVAYGAADDALFKTTSYFRADCFPIYEMTGPQQGKMIGYGDLHGLYIRGALLWIGYGGGGGDTAYAYRLDAIGISRVAHPLTGIDRDNIELHRLSGTVVVTVASDFRQANYDGRNAHRSTDGGVTWAEIPIDRVVSITQDDGAGTCYLLAMTDSLFAVNSTSDIYKTTDYGATWTLVYHHSAPRLISSLAMDPNNTDRLAFRTRWNEAPFGNPMLDEYWALVYSDDGGATWDLLGDDNDYDLETHTLTYSLDGSKVIYADRFAGGNPFAYGSSTPTFTRTESAGTKSSADMGAVSKDGVDYRYGEYGIWRSSDQGVTWSELTINGVSELPVRGFVPGDIVNEWYALIDAVGYPIYRRAANSSDGDTWTDIGPSVDTAFPDNMRAPMLRGAVLIDP